MKAIERRKLALAAVAGLIIWMLVGSAVGAQASILDEHRTLASSFEREQLESDQLPTFLLEGEQRLDDVVPSSTRLIGSNGPSDHWIAVGQGGEVCFIALLSYASQFAAMTCQTTEAAGRTGLALQLGDLELQERVYFIPDEFVGSTMPRGLESSSENLVVGDPLVSDSSLLVLNSRSLEHAVLKLPKFEAIDVEGATK